jgi:hypothetical protein
MSGANVGYLMTLVLRLCKASEDAEDVNPLEVAKVCVQNGRKELALLLLHIPLTDNLATSAGLVLVNPWEEVLDICILRKSELEDAGMGFREFKSFTLDATITRRRGDEEERRRLRSESYYVAVLDTVDIRTSTRYRKAFVYYLTLLGGSYVQFNVFIILDTEWIDNVVKTLCQS